MTEIAKYCAWIIGLAIVGFTSANVISHLASSVKEKQDLMESTAEMAQKLGLSPEDTAALLQTTSEGTKTGGGGSDIMDTIKWLGIAYVGLQLFKSSK